jgi:outer membrane protein TolC
MNAKIQIHLRIKQNFKLFIKIMNSQIFAVIILFFCFKNLWGEEPLLLSLKQAEDLAIENNYHINASLHRLEEGYYGYQASKAYFLPNIDLGAGVDLLGDLRGLNAALRLTQPLYDKVASYHLKEAQIQWEQLKLEVQQQICDTLFQVREAYYEIVLHQAHLVVDQMIIQIWQDELKRQERHLELGASIPYEVNQTQLHLKNAWIDFYATQKNSRTSQIKLLTILSLSPDTSFSLAESHIPLPEFNWQKSEREQWKKWAFQYRPELKQQQFTFLLSQNKIQQTKAEKSPTLSLFANVGNRYVNNGFDHQPYAAVGVNLDWTLYDPSNKQKIKQAQEESRGVACDYYQLELETAAEIYNLLNEIEHLYQSYLAAQEGAVLAEEGMQLATKKRQLGAMSAFEFRDTIKTLHEAQQQVNQAKFDLRSAYDRLVQHTGIDLDMRENIHF